MDRIQYSPRGESTPMRKLFGTDGIRGRANLEPMTAETVLELGRAVAMVLTRQTGRPRAIIGKDTRLSGDLLESAMALGLCSMGVDVWRAGPIPTPAIAFLTRSLQADCGVMISASHNPFEDNGVKFFCQDGFKLPDEVEARIENLLGSERLNSVRPTGEAIGRMYRLDDAQSRYIEFVKSTLPKGPSLQGMKIVVDCAHGAAYKIAPDVLSEMGAEVIVLGNAPNGININQGGAMDTELLRKKVCECHADIGIAYDGDADRAVFVDETATQIPGEAVLAALALAQKKAGTLQRSTLVTTEMSNMGMERTLCASGIDVIRTAIGDRYVIEKMREGGYNLGGETSGHMILFDHHTTGDGLIASLHVLRLMQTTSQKASQLASCVTLLPMVLKNVPVPRKDDFSKIPGLATLLSQSEVTLNGRGRILVRYSGTESLLRIMIEGEADDQISEMAASVADCVCQHMAAP